MRIGTASFTAVPKDPLQITARVGTRNYTMQADGQGQEAILEVPPHGRIQVSLKGLLNGGKEADPIQLEFRKLGDPTDAQELVKTRRVDPQDPESMTVEADLLPGSYELAVLAHGSEIEIASRTVQVTPDQPTIIDL